MFVSYRSYLEQARAVKIPLSNGLALSVDNAESKDDFVIKQ